MIFSGYTLHLANKMKESFICAEVCSEGMNIFVRYLGRDFKLLRFFEGSRYIFDARCVWENRIDNYSLWYSGGYGRPFLNDDLHLECCYGYTNFLGQRILCISKQKKEILKIKIKKNNNKDMFICKNEIVAELSSCPIFRQTEMQYSDCLQVMIKNKAKFDVRILLLYIIWKIIDKMDIYSCGI